MCSLSGQTSTLSSSPISLRLNTVSTSRAFSCILPEFHCTTSFLLPWPRPSPLPPPLVSLVLSVGPPASSSSLSPRLPAPPPPNLLLRLLGMGGINGGSVWWWWRWWWWWWVGGVGGVEPHTTAALQASRRWGAEGKRRERGRESGGEESPPWQRSTPLCRRVASVQQWP